MKSLFKSGRNASVADESGAHSIDESEQIKDGLERELAESSQMQAAQQLSEFTLTPGAKSLLDRAVDNLSSNDGASIDDPDLRIVVRARASLIAASGNDLSVAIRCIVDSCSDDPKAIAPMIYSLLYNVLKNGLFFANLDYRRYLDPRSDFDLTPYMRTSVEGEALGTEFEADSRSEQREPPLGMDSTIDREWAYFREVYGTGVEITEDIFAAALADLRLFLTLTAEAYGWDASRPMPYANIAERDGTFTPITDASLALDHAEIKRKEALAKRRARDTERMAAAAQRATELATAALRR